MNNEINIILNFHLTHRRLQCDTCGLYDFERQQWYLVSKFSISHGLLSGEQQIHTLNKTALVQSVCMDIHLNKTIVRLTFLERNNKVKTIT